MDYTEISLTDPRVGIYPSLGNLINAGSSQFYAQPFSGMQMSYMPNFPTQEANYGQPAPLNQNQPLPDSAKNTDPEAPANQASKPSWPGAGVGTLGQLLGGSGFIGNYGYGSIAEDIQKYGSDLGGHPAGTDIQEIFKNLMSQAPSYGQYQRLINAGSDVHDYLKGGF